MRHVSRTHRVALDWLFDRINLDSKIEIKYIDTKNQLADILTKGNFTRDEWNHLLNLFNISHFSCTACTAAMAKRAQQESGEERVTAKSRPMMSFIARAPSNLSSSTSESTGRKRSESQSPWSAKAEKYDRKGQPVIASWARTHEFQSKRHASPFAQSSEPTYRGDPPTPPPAPVLGPSPAVHLAHSDPFARARIAAVQSRVAAPVLSDPRPPPPVPVFSPFRDGHYWCSKCPRRGFTTIPGLMRHVTHQHAGSSVDEATCSLFAAIERVTCTAPACGGLRRSGARICNRCGQARPGPPEWVTSSWALLVLPPIVRTWSWLTLKSPPHPASVLISPLSFSRLASRSAFARFPPAPFCTSLPAAACA